VSGGDALVRLTSQGGSVWTAKLNGTDATRAFHPVEGSQDSLALLSGLKLGKNILEIRVGGSVKSRIEIINYPLSGPIFSGPHQQPFVCQTEAFGLGVAQDANCNVKTLVRYYYKPTHPESPDFAATWSKALQVLIHGAVPGLPTGYKPYDPEHPPTDVAQTTTSEGHKVPYIVRWEMGVINRSIYDVRFLSQPGQPLPTPFTGHTAGWNGRLVYGFGGGCGAAYRQGSLWSQASDEAVLAEGYAVVGSTLNIFGNDCNDVLSAETLSMVKEHFIKAFGEPVHTIGWGGSGGAMQQHLIAQNYPGLLDGIIPYVSFPDIVTYVPSTSDCGLLVRAFDKSREPWTDEQKSAATGFVTWRVCPPPGNGFAVSARSCNPAIPKEATYDPVDRPKGARCDIYDNEITVYGRDPKTGFARRPLDNVGVQYGLVALNAGKITPEQFVELNEQAGGYDIDGNLVDSRTETDAETLRQMYQHGLVLTGGGGLPQVPIIDWRWYSDDMADNHDSFRSFVTRARLKAANGTAANQVILIDSRDHTTVMTVNAFSDPDPKTSRFARRERDLVGWMDHWLDNIAADRAAGTAAEKVARDKPSDLADACWAPEGNKIAGDVFGPGGKCSQMYPQHGDPRIAAGGPFTDDVVKCALKPIAASDYTQPLSSDQLERLKAVFPHGVCDYSRPGLGHETTSTTWQRYPSGG